MTQAGSYSYGQGSGASRAQVQDLNVSFRMNALSPKLMEYCASGKHIEKVIIMVSRDGPDGTAKPAMTIELTDVIISTYQTGGSGDDKPIDSMGLNFGKVTQNYDAAGLADKAK